MTRSSVGDQCRTWNAAAISIDNANLQLGQKTPCRKHKHYQKCGESQEGKWHESLFGRVLNSVTNLL